MKEEGFVPWDCIYLKVVGGKPGGEMEGKRVQPPAKPATAGKYVIEKTGAPTVRRARMFGRPRKVWARLNCRRCEFEMMTT